MDNFTGLELVGNTVWVANAGTNNGAPGDAIVFIDATTGNTSGSIANVGQNFDFVNYNGLVLGSDIDNEDLVLYNLDGTFNSIFHDSDGVSGIDFPQQLYVLTWGVVRSHL